MTGTSDKSGHRLDALQLLERVLREQNQDSLLAPLAKACALRTGAPRVAQLRRALEVEAGRDADH